jgi:uncharacterized surface protein with fasciclin (FAS1) repeats
MLRSLFSRRFLLVALTGTLLAAMAPSAEAHPYYWYKKYYKKCYKPNIIQVLRKDKDYTTLLALIERAGLTETLAKGGPFTLNAPTNAAFEKLPPELLKAVLDDKQLLIDVLSYHVLVGKFPAVRLLREGEVKTLLGPSISVRLKCYRYGKWYRCYKWYGKKCAVFINDSRVLKADTKARNGIVHKINAVLLPPQPE